MVINDNRLAFLTKSQKNIALGRSTARRMSMFHNPGPSTQLTRCSVCWVTHPVRHFFKVELP